MAGALTAAIAAAFAGSAAPSSDQYFEYTTLLLPGNGTNGAQNNTFLDGSTNNFTITRNGNTTQGTFSPFSQTGWGNYFAGSQSISIAATTALQYSGDFTIECWFYKPATGDATTFIQQSTNYFSLNVNPGTGINIYLNSASANFVITDRVPQINTWHHIALVRSGSGSGNIKCYLDGVASSTTATNTSTLGYNAIGYLGAIGTSAGGSLVGYISNFRIVSGRAVYTSNFTPPALPLTRTTGGTNPPQGSETIWLTAQSNRFLDSNGVNTPASSPLTITANGSPTVVAFSPFNPTASWSAATYGGSGYFDGSGDYLSVASTNTVVPTGTQDYAVEAWVYWGTQVTSYPQIISNPTTNGFQIVYDVASGLLAVGVYNVRNAITYAIAQSALANQWTHIVVTRSGNTHRMMVNGVLRANGTDSISFASPTTQAIGSAGAANYFVGYISSLRSVLGSIPTTYQTSSTTNGTAIFDPPTAPPTTTSQGASSCSLLLNFTNAGIYDATSKLVLETVNSASLSNAIAPKWGSTSIKFASSTSDYLWSNNQPAQVEVIGTSDFTIEGWVYLSTINTAFGIISRGTSTTGWSVNITSGNKLQFSYTASSLVGATSLVQNTWYYFAVVRSGSASGNLKLYLSTGGAISSADATSAGAVTDNFNQTNAIYVGADRVGTSLLNGYLQDIRLTNYARTITAAPTAAFPTL